MTPEAGNCLGDGEPSTIMRINARPLLPIVLLGALVCLLGGCPRGGAKGNFDDLFVSKHRHVIDEKTENVSIYGELTNTGAGRFKQVEVRGVLRSPGGDTRGENSVILENIQPREKRLFALSVHSHGRVADVDIMIRKPTPP